MHKFTFRPVEMKDDIIITVKKFHKMIKGISLVGGNTGIDDCMHW